MRGKGQDLHPNLTVVLKDKSYLHVTMFEVPFFFLVGLFVTLVVVDG